jgi:hypothetical protein
MSKRYRMADGRVTTSELEACRENLAYLLKMREAGEAAVKAMEARIARLEEEERNGKA